MPRSGAIKKISDPTGSPSFEPARLVQELLSLGHPKLTTKLATRIAQEVQKDLARKPQTLINAQSISHLVEFKFKELGLIDPPRAKKPKAPAFSATKNDPATFPEAEEVTRPLPESEPKASAVPGLLAQRKNTPLPTLEKFLKKAEAPLPASGAPISPPRARFQVDTAGFEFWAQNFADRHTNHNNFKAIHRMAEQLTHRVAQVETQFSKGQDPATLEVEFFNSLANQEFYPHFPTLLGAEAHLAYGPHQIWIDLPAGLATAEQALLDAKKIWANGGTVSFALDLKPDEFHWSIATFGEFLQGIETAMLDLPEAIGLPPMVGIHFSASHPLATEFAHLMLSGKYYPRFQLSLGLDDSGAPKSWVEKISTQCQSQWCRQGLVQQQGLPRWGGGPALRPYETCHLGTLNLAILASGTEVDWARLRRIIRSAVHFLDNLFEVTDYPLDLIQQRSLQSRKLGLGVMGFADLLAKLGFPYDSAQATILGEKISRFVHQESHKASVELAESRGAYPMTKKPHTADAPKRRHETLNGVCPSDILSRLAGVSPGIGPLPSLWAFQVDETMPLRPHPLLETIARRRQVWSDALAEEFSQKGSVRRCTEAATPLKKLFSHGGELDPRWLIKTQGAWEAHFDGGATLALPIVSDALWTENFPQGLSFAASALRSLSLQQNTLQAPSHPGRNPANEAAQSAGEESFAANTIAPRPRPERLTAITEQWSSPQGPLWFSLSQDELGPRELMVRWGKTGSHESVQAESLSRLITLLLGCAVAPELIAAELRGLRGPESYFYQGREILSLPDALAQILENYPGAKQNMAETEGHDHGEAAAKRPTHEIEEEITEAVDAETLH